MNFNPFFMSPLLGLDIQPDGIRLIQLKKGWRKVDIKRFAFKELPADVFTAGKIVHWDRLCSSLTELVLEQRLAGKPVAISLPVSLVRMQSIRLPAGLTDTDIEAEIRIHLQRDLPDMMDELRIDFNILSQCVGYSEISFVAVREEYLSQYLACVETAGLKVKIIDVDIFALKRAMRIYAILHSLSKIDYLLAYGLAMRESPAW